MLDSGLSLCGFFFLFSAEICRSCCNPGTFPQSLIYRHAGYLRQRYVGTVLHLLYGFTPEIFDLAQFGLMCLCPCIP